MQSPQNITFSKNGAFLYWGPINRSTGGLTFQQITQAGATFNLRENYTAYSDPELTIPPAMQAKYAKAELRFKIRTFFILASSAYDWQNEATLHAWNNCFNGAGTINIDGRPISSQFAYDEIFEVDYIPQSINLSNIGAIATATYVVNPTLASLPVDPVPARCRLVAYINASAFLYGAN